MDDAGITLVLHASDGGVSSNGYAVDGFAATFSGGGWKPSIKSHAIALIAGNKRAKGQAFDVLKDEGYLDKSDEQTLSDKQIADLVAYVTQKQG